MSDSKHSSELRELRKEVRQVLKQSKADSSRSAPAKARKKSKTGQSSDRVVSAPAARAAMWVRSSGGVSDIKALSVRWLSGYLSIGDGTLGAADQVFFSQTQIPSGTIYSGTLPVAMADTVFGATYIADMEKHFARKLIRRVKMLIRPFGTGAVSTSGISYVVGPLRGGENLPTAVTGNTAGSTFAYVEGMKGAHASPSWEPVTVDMTPFAVNATGGKEFVIGRDFSSTSGSASGTNQVNSTPCAFVVSGVNSGASTNRGKTFASVEFEANIDLLDFIGGITDNSPGRERPPRPSVPAGDIKYPPAPATGAKAPDTPSIGLNNDWELVEALEPSSGMVSARFRNRQTGEICSQLPLPQPKLTRQ